MKRFRIMPAAQADIREIASYIAVDRPLAADSWAGRLHTAFTRIVNQPGIGRARRDFTNNPALRFWRVDRHYIVYRYRPADGV